MSNGMGMRTGMLCVLNGNKRKSTHVTFTVIIDSCPLVTLNNKQLPQADVKYVGLYLDRKHVFIKSI